jgi:hypothetical protein
MRTFHSLCAILLTASLLACKDEPKQSPPPPPPAQPEPKGTSVNVGGQGVKVESGNTSVEVGKDTASIELPPKK